jgi:hypothetical protein
MDSVVPIKEICSATIFSCTAATRTGAAGGFFLFSAPWISVNGLLTSAKVKKKNKVNLTEYLFRFENISFPLLFYK